METIQSKHTYESTLAEITALGSDRMKLGTDRIRAVLHSLGNPQNTFRSIHVVGTNGKGSTSRVLASAYQAASYRVGLFTSPHLVDVRERIVIADDMLDKTAFAAYGQTVLACCKRENIALSYFECLTVIGFLAFKEAAVDVAIIEAGLGGRLDSTNVLASPSAVVITPISEDHLDLLGPTLEDIAREKAAVIHCNSPVIMAKSLSSKVKHVIEQQAQTYQAPLTLAEPTLWQAGDLAISGAHAGLREYRAPDGTRIRSPLLGRYQHINIGVAESVIHALKDELPVSREAFFRGLETAHWPGRVQLIAEQRLILDGSHNPQGLLALAQMIQLDLPEQPLELGISLLSTKDPEGLQPLLKAHPWQQITFLELSKTGHPYYTPETLRLKLEPALQELNTVIKQLPLEEWLFQTAKTPTWRICTGSLYTAGAVLAALNKSVDA